MVKGIRKSRSLEPALIAFAAVFFFPPQSQGCLSTVLPSFTAFERSSHTRFYLNSKCSQHHDLCGQSSRTKTATSWRSFVTPFACAIVGETNQAQWMRSIPLWRFDILTCVSDLTLSHAVTAWSDVTFSHITCTSTSPERQWRLFINEHRQRIWPSHLNQTRKHIENTIRKASKMGKMRLVRSKINLLL